MKQNNTQKSLTIALIGEPNAGKSTLLNALVGEKISIVTHKVQTTRHNIRGIINHENTQLVFIDTPGLFDAKRALEKAIVKSAVSAFDEADIVCLMFDINKLKGNVYKDVFAFIKKINRPIYAIINKVDLVAKDTLLPIMENLYAEGIFKEVIPLSALKSLGVPKFIEFLTKQALERPWEYEEDEMTDQPVRTICEEITREQAFILLHEEIPYSLKVETEKWEEDEDSVSIHQAIFVMKESQKAMVLGKGGIKVKEIGQRARFQMADLLGKRVSLYLYIKVRENWIEKDFSKYV